MTRMLRPALFAACCASLLILGVGPASADVTGACPDGYNPWVFHSGFTGVTYSCNGGSSNMDTAWSVAENACSAAWDDVDHLVTSYSGYSVHLSSSPDPWNPTVYRWYYSCKTCIQGYPPAWQDKVEHSVVISTGGAGGIGGTLVGGVVVGVELRGLDDPEGPKYYVDVVKGSKQVQVIVDAVTGEAEVARPGEPGSCQQ